MKLQLQSAGLWRRIIAALLFGAFGLAVFAALTRQGARVTDVIIEIEPTAEGQFLIQSKDVVARLSAGPHGSLVGLPIAELRLELLERFVEQDPFVRDANVYTTYAGQLQVEIEQAEPILRVHRRRSADYYIGATGAVLPLSKNDVVRVPVLTGDVPSFETAIADTVASEAYELAAALRASDLYGGLIEQIELDETGYTLVPKVGSTVYRLGQLSDLQRKLRDLEDFLRSVTPEVGWEHYREVDLRYDGQVVARRARGKSAIIRP